MKTLEVVYALPLPSTVVNTETNDCTTQVASAEVRVKAIAGGIGECPPLVVPVVPRFISGLDKFISIVYSEHKRRMAT